MLFERQSGFDASRTVWMVTAALLGLPMWMPLAQAQRRNPAPAAAQGGPMVEESSEVANLFRNAEDAIDRADWKLAIDSLSRIIADPVGLRKSTSDPTLYVSPRRDAYEMLASLPNEGLQAYHILHDGRARRLVDQARRDHDLGALRQICDRYLLTAHGVEAARLLGSWLLDAGREAEALGVLDDVLAVYPDGGGAMAGIELLRSVAMELLGNSEGATDALSRARQAMGGQDDEASAAVDAFIAASRGRVLTRCGTGFEPADSQVGNLCHTACASCWTGPGGGGACTGMMEAVVPSFAEHLPWRRAIPSVIPGVWPDLDALRPDLLPVTQPLVVDGRVFVKAGRECAAIDLQSFAVLWKAPGYAEGIAERARGAVKVGTSEKQLLSDYVTGTLSTSHGLVFNVTRGDIGVGFASDGIAVVPGRITRAPNAARDASNRLVAYDARTGELRWQRGRHDDPDERLQRVQFLAPALGIGDDLWVPFELSGDLYIGVLDPANGDMKHRIFLCALGGRAVNGEAALFCAHSDGTIYVPTGQGLFFAIDTNTYAIRWASRYRVPAAPLDRRSYRVPHVPTRASEWLSGPPVIIGGIAVLAPTDDNRLLAFDRMTGKPAWELPRARHRYIIAADRDNVWLGGEDISRISVPDRSSTWELPAADQTARAVMCGSTIYVPTRSGLMAIDRETGSMTATYDLPSDQTPLGTLVCSGGSLISLDTSELRAFPDRDSYNDTLAAHDADPTNVSVAIRLAYMELLRREPQHALDALRDIRLPDSAEAESHRAYASHLRVEALKQLGNAPGTPSEVAIDYLRRAVAAAEGRGDRIAAHMALGQKLRRIGRFKEAYHTLFSLGASITHDDMVVGASTPVQLDARTAIGDVLGRIEPELGTGERRKLSEEVGVAFAAAQAQLGSADTRITAAHGLLALANCAVLDGWDQAALNALGQSEMKRGKSERAEQYLLESIRRSSRRDRTAEALLLLLDLYLTPTQMQVRSALDIADRLDRDFSDVQTAAGDVASRVADRRGRIDAAVVATHTAAMEPAPFTIATRLAYRKPPREEALGLVGFRGQRVESQAGRLLLFAPPRTLRSYLLEDGSIEWESELLLRHDFVYDGTAPRTAPTTLTQFVQQTAMMDGQTLMINSRRGLHAVGMMTGRRLWAEPFDGGTFFGNRALRNDSTDVGDGRVAYLSAPRTLVVRRVVDGRVVWKRNMRSESVGPVRIRGDFVLTADPNLTTVHVFGLNSGAQFCRLTFHQPAGTDGVMVPISYYDGVLCGPDGQAVVGYNARTGTRVWSLTLTDDPSAMFQPIKGRLIVGVAGGHHWLVNTKTGDVIFEQQYDTLVGGAQTGVLESGVLVLAGVEDTAEGHLWHLIGVNPDPSDGGSMVWQHDLRGLIPGPQLRMVNGVIPMVALLRDETVVPVPEGHAPPAIHYRQAVVLIDKHTGDYIGEPVYADLFSEQLTGDLAVWPGRLVLQTRKTVITLPTTPIPGDHGHADGVD